VSAAIVHEHLLSRIRKKEKGEKEERKGKERKGRKEGRGRVGGGAGARVHL
jgi:hypothetical protein